MEKKLKLYVWEGVLQDYSCGLAVAMAYSVEEAKALLAAKGCDKGCFDNGADWEDSKLDGEEPTVYEVPAAAWVFGGG